MKRTLASADRDKTKKVLKTAAVILALAALLGAGTFATFNAQTRNPGNAFSNGTLVLSNKVNTATACLSTGGGNTDSNVNTACDTIFNATVKRPGDTASGDLTLKNDGSIDASALKAFANSACTNADNSETYHGTGNPCGAIALTIQQYSDAARTNPSTCVYGGGTATTCAFDATNKTLAAFSSAYTSSGSGLSLGALNAGSTDYLTVSVQLPSTAGNNMQGRKATMDFDWFAQQ